MRDVAASQLVRSRVSFCVQLGVKYADLLPLLLTALIGDGNHPTARVCDPCPHVRRHHLWGSSNVTFPTTLPKKDVVLSARTMVDV